MWNWTLVRPSCRAKVETVSSNPSRWPEREADGHRRQAPCGCAPRAGRTAADAVRYDPIAMMTQDDVTTVLDRLDGAGIDAWLDGGWAVDACSASRRVPTRISTSSCA